MTDEKNMTTGSPYAPWDLRKLPNFDFSEYLRKVEKPDGKGQTAEMTLEGTKRWFRLACPNGGLVLNALRVSDTMAIYEARVFADAGDRNPLASFTATQRADKAKGDAYIRAAQDAALEGALRASGFSLEVSLLARTVGISAAAAQPSQTDGGEQPAETPEPSPAPAQTDTPVQKTAGGAAPAAGKADQQPKPAADTAPRPAPVGPPPHEDAAPRPASVGSQSGASGENRPAPVGPQPHAAPSQGKGKPAPAVVNIGDARQTVAAENKPDGQVGTNTPPAAETGPAPETPPASHAAPAAASAPEAAAEETKPAPATYTPDMPVEEICQRMTLEQAQNLKVMDGTCKGWTLAQVAKDRPTSLRWLQSVCPFADNELKAAATIVLNDLQLKMAG